MAFSEFMTTETKVESLLRENILLQRDVDKMREAVKTQAELISCLNDDIQSTVMSIRIKTVIEGYLGSKNHKGVSRDQFIRSFRDPDGMVSSERLRQLGRKFVNETKENTNHQVRVDRAFVTITYAFLRNVLTTGEFFCIVAMLYAQLNSTEAQLLSNLMEGKPINESLKTRDERKKVWGFLRKCKADIRAPRPQSRELREGRGKFHEEDSSDMWDQIIVTDEALKDELGQEGDLEVEL